MVYQITTEGLRDPGEVTTDLEDVQWADATGTANAILAAYTPAVTALVDGMILGFRAALANTTSTPTFKPDGVTAHTITKRGGSALSASDIPGNDAEILVRYNLANTRWEMLMLVEQTADLFAVAAGTVNVITATYSPVYTALTDGLLLGIRASGANTAAVTFSPDGLTAHAVTKGGGVALEPGDIPGADAEVLLRYNLSNTRWEIVGMVDTAYFKALESDGTGADSTTAQPWFPTSGGITVKSGQRYFFEGLLYISRAAGAGSHTTGTLFAGTATITSINYVAQCKTGDANTLAGFSGFWGLAATELVVKAASTSTTEQIMIWVRGYVVINAGGTFIPQFKYTGTTPGGAPTIKVGSWFRMVPVGAATRGLWA